MKKCAFIMIFIVCTIIAVGSDEIVVNLPDQTSNQLTIPSMPRITTRQVLQGMQSNIINTDARLAALENNTRHIPVLKGTVKILVVLFLLFAMREVYQAVKNPAC